MTDHSSGDIFVLRFGETTDGPIADERAESGVVIGGGALVGAGFGGCSLASVSGVGSTSTLRVSSFLRP
jgi:hypothetical protein